MNKSILLVLLLLSLFFSGSVAQSLTGMTGLLNAPSANMQKDGTFYLGANYLNRNYINAYGQGKYNCLIYYFDLTFLPFLEINFRNNRQLDNPDHSHTVDRMLSVRLQILKERKYRPSIVIGANDLFTQATKGNQFFGALYAVATKNLTVKKNEFGFTFGYAYPYLSNSQFEGIFGGISFSPSFLRQLTLMAEYDSKNFNVGGSVLFFKHLYLFGLLQGMESISGGVAFKISAFSGFKSLKQKKNRSESKSKSE
jgi:hypothetical protein